MANSKKHSRELQVLLGLVELYLESGKPIGSNTLKDHGFHHLSSATIRNYFAELEEEGFLRQAHASGGRIPTNKAFRIYAAEYAETSQHLSPELEEKLQAIEMETPKDLVRYLQLAAQALSQTTGLATFLSSVRFDQDFILDIKLLSIDSERLLCALITDFGRILTEVLPITQKLSSFSCKRIETHIQSRLKGGEASVPLTDEELALARELYNEIMVRYIVGYSNFSQEEIFRTGFSQLLAYPEFSDPIALTTGLSLFENSAQMRLLLNDCAREGKLRYWIGEELLPYAASADGCSVIAIPYHIGSTVAGAIGILGPCRIPYSMLFSSVRFFADHLSKSLTKSLLKFKLSFRQPRTQSLYVASSEQALVVQTTKHLLEMKEAT